jgi:hypothetical protein
VNVGTSAGAGASACAGRVGDGVGAGAGRGAGVLDAGGTAAGEDGEDAAVEGALITGGDTTGTGGDTTGGVSPACCNRIAVRGTTGENEIAAIGGVGGKLGGNAVGRSVAVGENACRDVSFPPIMGGSLSGGRGGALAEYLGSVGGASLPVISTVPAPRGQDPYPHKVRPATLARTPVLLTSVRRCTIVVLPCSPWDHPAGRSLYTSPRASAALS